MARRIHFAGTETASLWRGFISGAIQSGERAADEVVSRVSPSHVITAIDHVTWKDIVLPGAFTIHRNIYYGVNGCLLLLSLASISLVGFCISKTYGRYFSISFLS